MCKIDFSTLLKDFFCQCASHSSKCGVLPLWNTGWVYLKDKCQAPTKQQRKKINYELASY